MAMQRFMKGNLPAMLSMEVGALQSLSPDDGKYLFSLIDDDHLELWDTADPVAFIGLLKAVTATAKQTERFQKVIMLGMRHSSPRVRAAAAEAMAAHPESANIPALASILKSVQDADLMLRHTLKLALREHLKLPGAFASLSNEDKRLVTDIAKAVPTADAAAFLFDEWKAKRLTDSLSSLLGTIARNGSSALMDQALAEVHQRRSAEAITALNAIHNGLLERGSPPPPALLAWATELAESALDSTISHESHWTHQSYASHPNDDSPWCLQERKCKDGTMATVISSLDKDKRSPEKLTGILRSKAFAAPAKLSFWLCGHQGLPNTDANHKNLVRLVASEELSAGTTRVPRVAVGVSPGAEPSNANVSSKPSPEVSGGTPDTARETRALPSIRVLREAFPPRSDVCQRIEWDLSDLASQQVRLEIVDGDDGPSFAWLGVTRIEPAVVKIESFTTDNQRQKQLRTLASILKTTAPVGLRDRLAPYLPKPAVAPAPPQPRPELDALIAARRTAFAKLTPDAAKGEAIFKANCAVCHTIKGQGGVIGPQLDGVGNRGADRLMEDILDPNRNVDAHFHLHQLKLRDGSTVTGFIRGEVGQVTILVDAANNDQRIAKGDIAEDTDLPQSLMPPAFGQMIPEAAFHDLIAWLLKH